MNIFILWFILFCLGQCQIVSYDWDWGEWSLYLVLPVMICL